MSRERIHRKLLTSYLAIIGALVLSVALMSPRASTLRGLLVGGALSLGMAAWFAASARRATRAIEELTASLRAIADGRAVRPTVPRGDDELGALAQAVGESGRRYSEELDALRAEGAKLRTVLDGMSEGVALLAGGRIALANPAFTRLLEVGAPVEGRTPLEAVRRHDIATAIAAAGAGAEPEARDVAMAGGRVLQLRVAPLGGGSAVVVLLDVTEGRSLERMRREFVANASHELRTPAAAIQAVAETLAGSGSAGPTLPPDARRRFENILLSHAGRLSRLVNDLLDLSRAEATAGRAPRHEAVALEGPLGSAIAAVRERAEAKKLRLEQALPSDLPPLDADPTSVEQVLVNLLDNAVKYTPDGGRVQVRASAASDGGAADMVRIEVEDDGPGIPADHLPRIFERFYRVDPARSRELGGTGLGLAIVKHLVQAHGGEVSVSSTVGAGSIFRVTFPVARRSAA